MFRVQSLGVEVGAVMVRKRFLGLLCMVTLV